MKYYNYFGTKRINSSLVYCVCFARRLTSKRKSSGDATVICNKAQSTVDETFAHKKRRRALKQMQEVTADKDNNKGSSEQQQQQQDNNNGGGSTAATQKTMVLPKKRPLAGQPANGAVTAAGPQTAAATPKKQAKASGDEAVDDETLIRETEAALKSLSGGWPGARHSFYRTGHDDDRYESPAFVNLFDEKKIGSASSAHPPPPPPPTATRVDENKNNTNDVKTAQPPPQQQRRDLDHILLNKIDQNNKECEHNKKPDKYAPSKYEPDFNELVDDSSDELEIDMSADGGGGGSGCSGGDDKGDGGGGGDDEDDNDDDDDDENGGCGRGRSRSHTGSGDRLRRKMDVDRRNNNSHVRPDEMMTSLKSESESSSYDAYLMDKTAFSAFRPVASGGVGESKDPTRLDLPTAVGAAMSPLGPYPPAGATFVVGYTGPGGGLVSNGVGVSAAGGGGHGSTVKHLLAGGNASAGGGGGGVGVGQVTPVKPVCVKLEDDGCSGGAGDCKADGTVIKMDSPSPLSKQYTILQPAGADSRAATALQDVAREGVLGASVVSAAGGDGLSPRMTSSGGGTTKLLLDPVDGGLMLPGCMNNKGKHR